MFHDKKSTLFITKLTHKMWDNSMNIDIYWLQLNSMTLVDVWWQNYSYVYLLSSAHSQTIHAMVNKKQLVWSEIKDITDVSFTFKPRVHMCPANKYNDENTRHETCGFLQNNWNIINLASSFPWRSIITRCFKVLNSIN